MRLHRAAIAVRLAVATLALGASACDALVGADCIDEYTVCGGMCVDMSSDPNNCGGCGVVCDTGTCADSVCVGTSPDGGTGPDASLADASMPFDGSMAFDGSMSFDGSMPFDGMPGPDAGVMFDASTLPSDATVCTLPEVVCGNMCADLDTDENHCGGCFDPCSFGEVCTDGICCAPPNLPCGNQCVDMSSDPDNCGMCGVVCSSGICVADECLGGITGHVIVIGHDYVDSRIGMNRLVGNSVFLATGASVDVLVYEGDATAGAIAGTDAAIDQVSAETGRAWVRTAATSAAEVPDVLVGNDVFIVYAQEGGNDVGLAALGTMWQSALDTFVNIGGVIIVLEGGGAHAGTYQILEQAGLFSATSRTVIASPILTVVDPGNAIAIGVNNPYLGEDTTVSFATAETTVVVQSPSGPVVIHRLIN